MSLHAYFEGAGLASHHTVDWPAASRISEGRAHFDRADAFSDGEGADFIRLHRWFPQALFILNTRDERAWLRSRVKHVFRYEADGSAPPPPGGLGWMAREFHAAPALAIDAWIARRRIYEAHARDYFSGAESFVELRVPEEPDWTARLGQVLLARGIPLRDMSDRPALHTNARSGEAFGRFPEIQTYFDLVDERLGLAGSRI